jgi:hypothetical protein
LYYKEMPVRRSKSTFTSLVSVLFASLLRVAPLAMAQTPAKPDAPKPTPDVLVFTNGDQLTGKLERAAGGNVVFASDMAGELTISVDKVKEIRSGSKPQQFALLKKGVPVNKKTPAPEGTVTLADGQFTVHPDQPAANAESSEVAATVPAKDVDYLVAREEFDKQVSGKEGFIHGWNGSVTGGASVVRSTTSATTFTAGLNLVRAVPTVSWLPPRNRTTVDVNESYGKNTSPGAIPEPPPPAKPVPDVTTLSSIFHADAERDEYFSPRFYALADTSFDHNYAQGLQFQQVYGGGVGWTPVKSGKQELDLKADVHYEKQQFITALVNGAASLATVPSMNIIGSTVFESYRRTLPRKIIFLQTVDVLPAFNDVQAYSANLLASLTIPVFKRLSASVSSTDNFLNDPSPGYKKNSFQFVTGVTYALR